MTKIENGLFEGINNLEDLNEKAAELLEETIAKLDFDDTFHMIKDISSYDGNFGYLEAWENDEDFFETYFHDSAHMAVTKAFYGDYRPNDEYVWFDGMENLESMDERQLKDIYEDYSGELAHYLVYESEWMNLHLPIEVLDIIGELDDVMDELDG